MDERKLERKMEWEYYCHAPGEKLKAIKADSCATRVITQHLQQSLCLHSLLLKCAHLTASIHRMCRFLRLTQFVLRLWCVAISLTCSVGRSRSGQFKNAFSFHGCCHDAFVLMRPRDDNKMRTTRTHSSLLQYILSLLLIGKKRWRAFAESGNDSFAPLLGNCGRVSCAPPRLLGFRLKWSRGDMPCGLDAGCAVAFLQLDELFTHKCTYIILYTYYS
jgi:hypothetical protein